MRAPQMRYDRLKEAVNLLAIRKVGRIDADSFLDPLCNRLTMRLVVAKGRSSLAHRREETERNSVELVYCDLFATRWRGLHGHGIPFRGCWCG